MHNGNKVVLFFNPHVHIRIQNGERWKGQSYVVQDKREKVSSVIAREKISVKLNSINREYLPVKRQLCSHFLLIAAPE